MRGEQIPTSPGSTNVLKSHTCRRSFPSVRAWNLISRSAMPSTSSVARTKTCAPIGVHHLPGDVSVVELRSLHR